MRYTDYDCQDAWHDVDNAATHATDFRAYRQRYPRVVPATAEQLAAADALVAGWRAETDRTLQRIEAMRQHNREREAVSMVLTANVVEAFLEGLR
ncbi:MAG: hypothetical protein ACK528_06845 [Alphaproteobacteria bacterium]